MQTTWPRRADGKLCGLHAVTREVWIQRPVRGTNAEIHRDLRTQRPVCTTGAATTSARMHNERRPQASNHMNATNECSPLRLLRAPQRGWFSRLPLPGPPAGQRETIPSVEQCKCNNQSTCTNSGTPTSPKPCETDQPGEGTPAVAEPRPAAVRGGTLYPGWPTTVWADDHPVSVGRLTAVRVSSTTSQPGGRNLEDREVPRRANDVHR